MWGPQSYGLFLVLQALQNGDDLVQQTDQSGGRRTVEEIGYATEQIAEQVARAWNRADVYDDLVGGHLQAQDIEIDRAQHQVQDAARGCRCSRRASRTRAHWSGYDREVAYAIGIGSGKDSVRDQRSVLKSEAG